MNMIGGLPHILYLHPHNKADMCASNSGKSILGVVPKKPTALPYCVNSA
jgi:hypothetical protein